MKKKIYYALLFILVISVFYAEDVYAIDYVSCGGNHKMPLTIVNMVKLVINLIKICVPIFLIISGMVGFAKVVSSSNVDDDMKKAKSKFVNSLIAAFVVFFVVFVIEFVINLTLGNSNNLVSCLKCFTSDNCEVITVDDDEFLNGVNDEDSGESHTDDSGNSHGGNGHTR